MSENIVANPGSGGDTIAADDISGVKHTRVKVEWGANNTAVDTEVANPLPVQVVAAVGAGVSCTRLGVANSINAAVVKNGAATLFGMYVVNLHTAVQYVKLWDKGSAAPDPSADTASIAAVFPVPASSTGAGFVFSIPQGMAFANGIGVATTGALADADETAVTASTVIGQLFWK